MEDKCEKHIKRANIAPQWLPGGTAFWYRQNQGSKKSSFIFVDAIKKERRPAFDHELLAKALREKVGQHDKDIDARSLPFTWIDLAADESSVRFFYEGKKWCFGHDGNLEEWQGTLNGPETQFLSEERASGHSVQPTAVTFINHTNAALSSYWIDWDGKAIFYGVIGPGELRNQKTFVGHVWKLVDEVSSVVKGIYVASKECDLSAIVTENTMREATAGNIWESKSESQEEGHTASILDDEELPQLFVRNFNLWVRDFDEQEFRLSSGGSEMSPYDDSRVFVSPNKKFCVAWQFTPEEDHKLHLRESAPRDQLEPKVRSIRYLKPGDRVRVDRPRLFDLESKKEVSTDDAMFRNPWALRNMSWAPDSSEYRFVFNERGHQNLRVLGIDNKGIVRCLVAEVSETFIDYSSKHYLNLIEETDELIWASERDGFNHLYLFDLKKAELRNQITTGRWNVNLVVLIEEERRRVWFRGYGMVPGQDPYHAHLACVNFDGTGFQVLTDGDGTHMWSLSPDNSFFVDTWSRVDSTPRSVLRSLETGRQLVHLEGGDTDTEGLANDGWVIPERLAAPGRDGETPIYGIMIRPSDFDSARKYPVLECIYAGPHDFHTPKQFSALSSQRKWADQGYIVVQIDGMGTNWRSKEFHDMCWKNLKDAGFPDRIAWINAAAKNRPWMDTSRVGLIGGSAGGQNAVAGLLFYGDFYKAAIADSGCHDNRMDKIWWNEQWMGYPVDKSYEDSSNVVHANKLKGALLLIVGEMDDNVDPASTLQLVKALNDASKEHELLFIPGAGHCPGRRSFALRQQEAFLRRYLEGYSRANSHYD